jgi:hypothetical protein
MPTYVAKNPNSTALNALALASVLIVFSLPAAHFILTKFPAISASTAQIDAQLVPVMVVLGNVLGGVLPDSSFVLGSFLTVIAAHLSIVVLTWLLPSANTSVPLFLMMNVVTELATNALTTLSYIIIGLANNINGAPHWFIVLSATFQFGMQGGSKLLTTFEFTTYGAVALLLLLLLGGFGVQLLNRQKLFASKSHFMKYATEPLLKSSYPVVNKDEEAEPLIGEGQHRAIPVQERDYAVTVEPDSEKVTAADYTTCWSRLKHTASREVLFVCLVSFVNGGQFVLAGVAFPLILGDYGVGGAGPTGEQVITNILTIFIFIAMAFTLLCVVFEKVIALRLVQIGGLAFSTAGAVVLMCSGEDSSSLQVIVSMVFVYAGIGVVFATSSVDCAVWCSAGGRQKLFPLAMTFFNVACSLGVIAVQHLAPFVQQEGQLGSAGFLLAIQLPLAAGLFVDHRRHLDQHRVLLEK